MNVDTESQAVSSAEHKKEEQVFPSLPSDAGVRHILALNRDAGRLLAAFHEQILRGPSNLGIADRELIAAYVSGLNRCDYCCGCHTYAAQFFGVTPGIVQSLLEDETLESASSKLRPLLAYARKLTLEHRRIRPDDAQAVFDAGWSERDLHDAILVACTFNFMNRLVHGHGIRGDDVLWRHRGRYLFENGYEGVVNGADEIRYSVISQA